MLCWAPVDLALGCAVDGLALVEDDGKGHATQAAEVLLAQAGAGPAAWPNGAALAAPTSRGGQLPRIYSLRGRVARFQNPQVRGQLGVGVLLVLEEDLRHTHGRVDPDLGC